MLHKLAFSTIGTLAVSLLALPASALAALESALKAFLQLLGQ